MGNTKVKFYEGSSRIHPLKVLDVALDLKTDRELLRTMVEYACQSLGYQAIIEFRGAGSMEVRPSLEIPHG